jgi:hypothetical protein
MIRTRNHRLTNMKHCFSCPLRRLFNVYCLREISFTAAHNVHELGPFLSYVRMTKTECQLEWLGLSSETGKRQYKPTPVVMVYHQLRHNIVVNQKNKRARGRNNSASK